MAHTIIDRERGREREYGIGRKRERERERERDSFVGLFPFVCYSVFLFFLS